VTIAKLLLSASADGRGCDLRAGLLLYGSLIIDGSPEGA
jgi:hypothetical protein